MSTAFLELYIVWFVSPAFTTFPVFVSTINSSPPATFTAFVIPFNNTGSVLSIPATFPITYTSPLLSTNAVYVFPATTSMIFAVCGIDTLVGVSFVSLEFVPSCPLSFAPHVYTSPYLFNATLCLLPVEIFTISPSVWINVGF